VDEPLALTGLTILELTTGIPGGYCGRLLAMLGADVVKLESSGRPDEARRSGPFPADVPHHDRSGLHRHLHAQKRSVALDVATPTGARLLDRLASTADVVLDDGTLGRPPGVRARYDELLDANERLVVAAFSPFGLDGPRAHWESTELTELAAGGWLPHGPDGGPPLMPGSACARYGAGTLGALGVLLALAARRRDGRGQLVEVALNEAFVHFLTTPTAFHSYTGTDMPRMGDGYPYGIYRCADGHLGISILTQPQWEALCELMDRADLVTDPRFRSGAERADPAVAEEIDGIIRGVGAHPTGSGDLRTGAGHALPRRTGSLASRGPAVAAVRGARLLGRVRRPRPRSGAPPRPAVPFGGGRLVAVPSRPTAGRRHRCGPLRTGAGRGDPPSPHRRRGAGVTRPPLEGVRVLDLTAWQAGPMVTMMLGDFGAEVVKIEAPGRLDGWRGSSGLDADRRYERSPIWNAVNRSKLGISLDLKSPRGRDLFLRLVAEADVVVENFSARVMENLGLGYEVLRDVNDRIVMAALSGYGQTGPYRDYTAFAFPTEELSGLAYLNGERGGPPVLVGASVTDAFAGAMGAFAVVAALERRERTGRGDFIDLSQIETLTTFIGGELLEPQLHGRDPERAGNERPGMAPHGLYPCLPDGDLVAVAVRDDDEWVRLCGVIGRPDLADDATLASVLGRIEERARIDDAVATWTAALVGADAVEQLQAARIPAAVAARASHLSVDEQLWARDFFVVLDRAEVGAHPYAGPVVRLTRTPAVIDRPAPLYGQHTAEVLQARLGLTDAELAELHEAGITSVDPLPQDWR
jgi:crotonobetainyl-CoA:carnitine CoA-transferase CaiB-like acyl-CoA transferase